jgi:SAM-dependent methyltransferase
MSETIAGSARSQQLRAPDISDQQRFWNSWDSEFRENRPLDQASLKRAEAVLGFVDTLNLSQPAILEVGCANGWLSEKLARFGTVTAVDLADEVVTRAALRIPEVRFLAGDFMAVPLPRLHFDLAVSLETLPYVVNQTEFLERIAGSLRPGGYLVLTCVNKFVFERWDDVRPSRDGQIRQWLRIRDLKRLLRPRFTLVSLVTLLPAGHRGVLRIVNSLRFERFIGHFLPSATLTRIKERCGFGQTIVVAARKS